MKLRNKKTGEIIPNNGIYFTEGDREPYSSLAELTEEWEDYEEPKEKWLITEGGNVIAYPSEAKNEGEKIGNCFITEEEAEQAVEKLKAWKRLKDKGFKFTAWYGGSDTITYEFADNPKGYIPAEECADLDLLFGGEE